MLKSWMIGKWVAGFKQSLLFQISRDPDGEERVREENGRELRRVLVLTELKDICNPARIHDILRLTIVYRNQEK